MSSKNLFRWVLFLAAAAMLSGNYGIWAVILIGGGIATMVSIHGELRKMSKNANRRERTFLLKQRYAHTASQS